MENECSWYDPSCSLKWLSDEFKALMLWFYDALLSGFAVVIEAIPLPDFLTNIPSFVLPSSVAWASDALNLTYGITVIVGAYVARFILRRIPFIG
jgi:hypothetical protein